MTRRLPAEWEPQDAILLTWPHEQSDWAPWLAEVEQVYLSLTAAIAERESVHVICRSADHVESILGQLGEAETDMSRVNLHILSSNDTWVRDYGPITVFEEGRRRFLDLEFNGWGGKHPAALDNQINRRLHDRGVLGDLPLEYHELVLEGGSIDSDGAGTLLTTSRCLLSRNRDPSDEESYLLRLERLFGTRRVLWLHHGELQGDDTDGHVDMLARFCDEGTIAFATSARRRDHNHRALEDMRSDLEAMRTDRGSPYRLVPLPCPAPKRSSAGELLPASYANFLIINGAVLVPIYDDPADQTAQENLAACFPSREIVPIMALPLIRQYGSLHCATMHLPAAPLLAAVTARRNEPFI